MKIKLLLLDIDGCLNSGKNIALDLESLGQLSVTLEELSDQGIKTSLCTGRAQGYAEAIAQLLGLRTWHVCENGAMLYDSLKDKCLPLVAGEELTGIFTLKQDMQTYLSGEPELWLEAGKDLSISVTGTKIKGQDHSDITALMSAMMGRFGDRGLHWAHSSTAIDVCPKGVSKAYGVERLLEELGMGWENVAAVGDSNGDLPVLEKCAIPMCPNNASERVLQLSKLRGEHSFAKGTLALAKSLLGSL